MKYPTGMTTLTNILKARKVPFTMREHPLAHHTREGQPIVSKWQIIVADEFSEFSVIRGYASGGSFEIMALNNRNGRFVAAKRFKTAKELVDALYPSQKVVKVPLKAADRRKRS